MPGREPAPVRLQRLPDGQGSTEWQGKSLVPFLPRVLPLNQTFSMGKAFRSVRSSSGTQLRGSPQEGLPGLLTGEAEGSGFIRPREEEAEGSLFAVCHYLEGGYRQEGARLFSETHRERARANSCDLQQGKFMPEQRVGLDTAGGPFPPKSFRDSLFFHFDRDKTKKLADKLKLLIEL